jgi:hypothetical protein
MKTTDTTIAPTVNTKRVRLAVTFAGVVIAALSSMALFQDGGSAKQMDAKTSRLLEPLQEYSYNFSR